jgi:hypothetical protein
MNRTEETKIVKNALKAAGIDASVKHGTGTAWGWLEIELNSGSYWRHNEALRIAMRATGRHGDYDGRILVQ